MFKNLFKKKTPNNNSDTPNQVTEGEKIKKVQGFYEKIKAKLAPALNNKLGKSAIKGEEIIGVEITNKEIRLAQVSSNNSNQWILDKFYIHPTNLPEDASVLDHLDDLGSELQLAIQRSKITTTNAANNTPDLRTHLNKTEHTTHNHTHTHKVVCVCACGSVVSWFMLFFFVFMVFVPIIMCVSVCSMHID